MTIKSYQELGIEQLEPMTFKEIWDKYAKLPKEGQDIVKQWASKGMDRGEELLICKKWQGFYMVAPSGAHIVIEKDSIQSLS